MVQVTRANGYAKLLLGLIAAAFIFVCFACGGGLTPEQRGAEKKRRASLTPVQRAAEDKANADPVDALVEGSIFEVKTASIFIIKSTACANEAADAATAEDGRFEKMIREGRIMLLEVGDRLRVSGRETSPGGDDRPRIRFVVCSVTRKGKDMGTWLVNPVYVVDDDMKRLGQVSEEPAKGEKELNAPVEGRTAPPSSPEFSPAVQERMAREKTERESAAQKKMEEERKVAVEAANLRTWTDSTGKHKIKAKYDGMAADRVKLTKGDGSAIQIPLEKFSGDDRQWIDKQKAEEDAAQINGDYLGAKNAQWHGDVNVFLRGIDKSRLIVWKSAAEKGMPEAQWLYGLVLLDGVQCQKDQEQAVKWFRKAAEQGFAPAQGTLGFCYHDGRGVPQDYDEAAKWSRKAAEQGFSRAQCNLGVCYREGQGVPQDYDEAAKWYRKAAEQGDAQAQCVLGVCYNEGQGVPKDYNEAVKWFRKAAEQGLGQAQSMLGLCYVTGRGVPKDYDEAVKWCRKAAEQGDTNAQKALRLIEKIRQIEK